MSEIRKFKSDGMLWNDGDIPECSFCGKNIDNCEGELHETPYSGEICCESEECKQKFLEECFSEGEVREITDEEDDEED